MWPENGAERRGPIGKNTRLRDRAQIVRFVRRNLSHAKVRPDDRFDRGNYRGFEVLKKTPANCGYRSLTQG